MKHGKIRAWAVGLGLALAALALGPRLARAFLGGVVVNGSYAYNQVVSIPLGAGVSQLGATVVYSSPSFSQATFGTGQVSTGTIYIANNAALSTATATESIVVTSTSGAFGDSLSMSYPIGAGAVVLVAGRDWAYGPTTSSAATSLAAALTANAAPLGGPAFVASSNVIYATAPVGAVYNNIAVVTNNANTLTVSSPTFLGGQDATIIGVNGVTFKQGKDWFAGSTAAGSATNLAAAINAQAQTSGWLMATASGPNVNIQSLAAGASFALASSNVTASTATATTIGAATPAWSLGGTTINLPSHGFVTGLAVLYSTVSAAPGIGGLTDQATYYVDVVDANDVALATTAVLASQGWVIPLTSSSTLTAAKTYAVTPLAFKTAATSGFDWVVSNDGNTWLPLSVSSVTYSAPGSSVWSFGGLPFAYLGLNVTAPTQGAMSLQVTAQGQ